MADSEHIVIDHVGHHGDGVAIAGGGNIYVPYTLGGETVEVAAVPGQHPDRRRLLRVEAASAERIAPFCPHFGVCGGCAIQHWDADAYRAWKRELVMTVLAQMGIDCDVAPLLDAHGAGRRRITLHGRIGTHDVLKVGYAAAGSHDIIPIDRCPILDPHLNGAIEVAWALAEPLIAMGKPLDIQITATNSGLDVDAVRLASQSIAEIGGADMGILIITHHDRLLEHNVPDFTHVMLGGRIVETGGVELARELYTEGYDKVRARHPEDAAKEKEMAVAEKKVPIGAV